MAKITIKVIKKHDTYIVYATFVLFIITFNEYA